MRLLTLIALLLGGLFLAGVMAPDAPVRRVAVLETVLDAPETAPASEPAAEGLVVTNVAEPAAEEEQAVPPSAIELAIQEAAEPETAPLDGAEEVTQREFDPVEVAASAEPEVAVLPVAEVAPEPEPEPELQTIHVVTGTRVNLRAGPSTTDSVLTQLVQGDRAIVLTTNEEDWSKISVLGTDIEGWMAARFLAEQVASN